MPIVKRTPTAPVENPPNIPQMAKETQQMIVADRNSVAVDSLVAYLDGSPWTVDWYSQLIGKHNDLRELDLGQNAAYQQYQKLIDLELRVTSALASSYSEEDAITTVNGTATVMYVIPNVNDYFIADAGSQKQGLYRVTSVERKTFNRDSVYEVNYTLVKYLLADTEEYVNLEAKVVRFYHFSKDRLVEGISPILTEDLYLLSKELGETYHKLLQKYFRTFMNRAKMTMNVPAQTFGVYDSRIVDFVIALVDSGDVPERRDMLAVSMDHEKFLAQPNFWTLLVDRDYTQLPYINKKYYLSSRLSFNRSSWIKGPAFWAFDFYVYPADPDVKTLSFGDAVPKVASGTALVLSETPLQNNEVKLPTSDTPIKVVPPANADDYYVLSKDFYDGTENLSVLEILVKDYVKKQTLDLSLLKLVTEKYDSWPVMERFYYGPILLILLKDAIRGFY